MTKEYDSNDNLISETAPDGRKYIYGYDDQRNRVYEIDPDGDKLFINP